MRCAVMKESEKKSGSRIIIQRQVSNERERRRGSGPANGLAIERCQYPMEEKKVVDMKEGYRPAATTTKERAGRRRDSRWIGSPTVNRAVLG